LDKGIIEERWGESENMRRGEGEKERWGEWEDISGCEDVKLR